MCLDHDWTQFNSEGEKTTSSRRDLHALHVQRRRCLSFKETVCLTIQSIFAEANFLSHLQPCQPNYCQERSRSPKNGEHRTTSYHTSGLRSPQIGPQLRPGTILHSQNYVFMTCLYHATILHVQKQDTRKTKNDLFGTFLANFLEGKWLEFCISPTTGYFPLIFVVMIFMYSVKSNAIVMA